MSGDVIEMKNESILYLTPAQPMPDIYLTEINPKYPRLVDNIEKPKKEDERSEASERREKKTNEEEGRNEGDRSAFLRLNGVIRKIMVNMELPTTFEKILEEHKKQLGFDVPLCGFANPVETLRAMTNVLNVIWQGDSEKVYLLPFTWPKFSAPSTLPVLTPVNPSLTQDDKEQQTEEPSKGKKEDHLKLKDKHEKCKNSSGGSSSHECSHQPPPPPPPPPTLPENSKPSQGKQGVQKKANSKQLNAPEKCKKKTVERKKSSCSSSFHWELRGECRSNENIPRVPSVTVPSPTKELDKEQVPEAPIRGRRKRKRNKKIHCLQDGLEQLSVEETGGKSKSGSSSCQETTEVSKDVSRENQKTSKVEEKRSWTLEYELKILKFIVRKLMESMELPTSYYAILKKFEDDVGCVLPRCGYPNAVALLSAMTDVIKVEKGQLYLEEK